MKKALKTRIVAHAVEWGFHVEIWQIVGALLPGLLHCGKEGIFVIQAKVDKSEMMCRNVAALALLS
jgi:hypothetical protein